MRNLLRNLSSFLDSVIVLVLDHFEFVSKAGNDSFLAVDLRLEVSSQNDNALLVGVSPSRQVINLSSESREVAFV